MAQNRFKQFVAETYTEFTTRFQRIAAPTAFIAAIGLIIYAILYN
jgi:hypothetical protein